MAALDPASVWVQLGNLFFTASALFGDVLLIRICLLIAYTWLLVAASVGYPSWPEIDNGPVGEPGHFSVDGIVWSCINIAIHGAAITRLLWDERRIKFADPLQQHLWLFFYRRSGMGKLEFRESFRRAHVQKFRAGETIMDPATSHRTLMLLVDGVAVTRGNDGEEVPLFSGFCFDVGVFNVLGVYNAFEKKHKGDAMTVTATTDCLAVFWTVEALNELASRLSPALAAFWRNFAMTALGLEWHYEAYPLQPLINGRGLAEPEGVRRGTARSSDFTDPLQAWEDPAPTLMGVLRWLPSTLAPLVPAGIRHNALPLSGGQARNRLLALCSRAGGAPRLSRSEPLAHRGRSVAVLRQLVEEGLLQLDAGQVRVVVVMEARGGGGAKAGGGADTQAA